MKTTALFLNGVYEEVLRGILRIQGPLPDQIMFLQPYSQRKMRHLEAEPPTVDKPLQVLISTTDNLGEIQFAGEIVGWRDKRKLDRDQRCAISRLIWTLQPSEEDGLYDHVGDTECVNLLFVRRLRKLRRPFHVTKLRLTSKGRRILGERSTAGGWSYVEAIPRPA